MNMFQVLTTPAGAPAPRASLNPPISLITAREIAKFARAYHAIKYG